MTSAAKNTVGVSAPRTKKTRRRSVDPKGRGTRWEREVRADLEARGYYVTRSAASAGCADLLAVGNIQLGEVLFVQCKLGGRCPPTEWNALYECATTRHAIPIIAMRYADTLLYLMLLRPKTPGKSGRSPWCVYHHAI